MKIPLASQTQTSTDILEVVSLPSLMDRAIAYFEQERYSEGMALLTLVSEHLTPEQLHLASLLEVLMKSFSPSIMLGAKRVGTLRHLPMKEPVLCTRALS